MAKYSGRERRRTLDRIHKLTTRIAREFAEEDITPVLEDLEGLSYNVARRERSKKGRKAKEMRRSITSWPYRTIQKFIEYKVKWLLGIEARYESAWRTTKDCPKCGSGSRIEGRVLKCPRGHAGDRDYAACVNLLKRVGVPGLPR